MNSYHPIPKVAIIQHQQAASTDGGAATSGARRNCTLNTNVSDPDGIVISLAANKVTLAPGIYIFTGSQEFVAVEENQLSIRDNTAGTDLAFGPLGYAPAGVTTQINVIHTGKITLTAQTDISMQYRNFVTSATFGLGFGQRIAWGNAVFATLKIEKIA